MRRTSVSGMAIVQEVKVQTRGPTEGTRHRGDKGVDLEHQVLEVDITRRAREGRSGRSHRCATVSSESEVP